MDKSQYTDNVAKQSDVTRLTKIIYKSLYSIGSGLEKQHDEFISINKSTSNIKKKFDQY